MSAPLLAVRELAVCYPVAGGKLLRAVDGLSFELGRGEALGLVGESGCGKSSVARAIVGLERPASGSLCFDGVELTTLSPRAWRPLRRRIQMVFQDPLAALDPRQSVDAIVREPLAIHRIGRPRERRLRALALLDAVGLEARFLFRYPHELSGGQRQRVAIARALALEPELLVCDEPVSALDLSIQAQVLNLLVELRERLGLAYLFIAHDLAVVRHLCQRVVVMYLGRAVEVAPCDELFARARHPYTQALLAAVPPPDPALARASARHVLAGEPPSPLAPPTGCRFHPRCPRRDEVQGERCAREEPALAARAELAAHRCACHLA